MTLDANTATREELLDLVGVGEVLADSIIAARPFETVDDLLEVPGIGPATLTSLEEQGLTVDENSTTAGEPSEGMPEEVLGPMPGETPREVSAEMAMPGEAMAGGLESMGEAVLVETMPGEGTVETAASKGAAASLGPMPGEVEAEVTVLAPMPGEEIGRDAQERAMPGELLASPGPSSYLDGLLLAGVDKQGALTLRGDWELTINVNASGG